MNSEHQRRPSRSLKELPFFVSAGATINYFAVRNAMVRSSVPGEFFSIRGRNMHLFCTGAGSPAVVIEAGLGDDWIAWQLVQPELAEFTRVCAYDRAGLGWIEPDPSRRSGRYECYSCRSASIGSARSERSTEAPLAINATVSSMNAVVA